MKSAEQWRKAKAMLRAGCPVKEVASETGIGKTRLYDVAKELSPVSQGVLSRISRRKKVENSRKWESIARTPRGQIALAEVEALQTLQKIEEEKASWRPEEVKVHDRIVLERLTLEEAFAGSAIRNQQQADMAVLDRGEAGESVSVDDLKKHAEVTKTNRYTVLGAPAPRRREEETPVRARVLIPEALREYSGE